LVLRLVSCSFKRVLWSTFQYPNRIFLYPPWRHFVPCMLSRWPQIVQRCRCFRYSLCRFEDNRVKRDLIFLFPVKSCAIRTPTETLVYLCHVSQPTGFV
jgi:hypothetical protein